MSGIILLWVLGVIANLLVGWFIYDGTDEVRGARVMLSAPLWPVTAIVGTVLGVRLLWRKAELTVPRRRR